MSKLDEIMEAVRDYGVESALADRSGQEPSAQFVADMIAAALEDARREGAEQMRDAAEQLRADADEIFPAGSIGRPLPVEARDVVEWYSESIRALPLPTEVKP